MVVEDAHIAYPSQPRCRSIEAKPPVVYHPFTSLRGLVLALVAHCTHLRAEQNASDVIHGEVLHKDEGIHHGIGIVTIL